MSFWSLRDNRRDTAEGRISARLEKMEQQNEIRDSVARYHKDLNLFSTQYRNLEEIRSNKPPSGNRESRLIELERAKSKEALCLRQAKLSAILAKENEKYLIEMNMLRKQDQCKDPWNIENLKQQIEQLNARRLETEESLRKSNFRNLRNSVNVPYVKEHESMNLEKEVIADMEQQRKNLERITSARIVEEEQKKGSLEQLRNQAFDSAKSAEIEKEQCLNNWDRRIQQHSAKLKENDVQRTELSESLKTLHYFEQQIENILMKHKQIVDIQRLKEQKVAMFRLSKEKLRKMTAEKKHSMGIDLSMVTSLYDMKVTSISRTVSDLNFDEALNVKKDVENQIADENKREQEMHVMFEEEAKRLWSSWEKQWNEKANIRENLLKSLVHGIKSQIRMKIDECNASQSDLVNIRQRLLQDFASESESQKEDEKELTDKREYFLQKVKDLDGKLAKVNPKYAMLNLKH